MKIVTPIDSKGEATNNTSIFLAGPTLREEFAGFHWRTEALQLLSNYGYDGTVYVPEPFCKDYGMQVAWEDVGLTKATIIAFWVPRHLHFLPGFTTNVEFGEWHRSGKCYLGYPPGAPKMRYLQEKATLHSIPTFQDLPSMLKDIAELLKSCSACEGNRMNAGRDLKLVYGAIICEGCRFDLDVIDRDVE